MRFTPALFEKEDGLNKFDATLKTYFFKLGGQHLQINVVDTETLRDAQEHPEKYEDLLVRVAGYSARFIDLTPPTQEEIIRRTEMCACG
jgi:formate C-acetyltransferase